MNEEDFQMNDKIQIYFYKREHKSKSMNVLKIRFDFLFE